MAYFNKKIRQLQYVLTGNIYFFNNKKIYICRCQDQCIYRYLNHNVSPPLLLSNYIGSLIFNRWSDRIKATARSQCALSYAMDIIDSHTALTIVKSSTLMI